jgi:outer membrane receptor for ferrienterochelin and colicin
MKKTILFTSILLSQNLVAQTSVEKLDKTVVVSDLRDNQLAIEANESMTIIDAETLEKAGTQHFQDVMAMVPNLNWSSATNRPRYFQIRGIGERSQYEGAPNPSVGFVVDDIDFSALGGVATLFDVEQIEVLRGPQGTRYGANGVAGLIYVKTKDPEFDSSYKISGLVGDDGDLGIGFRATGALSDSTAYRIALHQYNADGFRYNDYLNRDDTNKRDEFIARGKLFWQANSELDFNFTFLKANINNGFDTFNPENTFITHTDLPGKDLQDSTGLALKASWQGGNFDVMSITSYMSADIEYSFDGDWGNDDYWGEFAPYDFTSSSLRERTHISQEFRFIGEQWLAGVYVLDMSEDNKINEFFNGDTYKYLSSQFDATSIALFAQLDTQITPDNTLTSGIRFERRNASYSDSNSIDVSPNDNMW